MYSSDFWLILIFVLSQIGIYAKPTVVYNNDRLTAFDPGQPG